MICIKKIICLLFCVFLVSCKGKIVENPFDSNRPLTGTYICDGESFNVTVTKSDNCVTVKTTHPEGYAITFSDSGAKISFNGLEFDSGKETLSRFYPLFEMAHGINTIFEKTAVTHSDGYVFGDFK